MMGPPPDTPAGKSIWSKMGNSDIIVVSFSVIAHELGDDIEWNVHLDGMPIDCFSSALLANCMYGILISSVVSGEIIK